MPKIKITNLKPGACVINSLRVTIAGNSSVTRDASVVGDPDLTELESYGVVAVTPLEEVDQKPSQTAVQQPPTKQPQSSRQNEQVQPPKAPKRPGTDFRAVDGPEDQMGGKVIVVGEQGPEVRRMDGGLNAKNGPKYVGDDAWQDTSEADGEAEGFTTI